MDSLDRCYKIVLQNSVKGVSAVDIANQLNVHRTTVHNYLNSLELMGKVHNEHGLWYPKTVKQGIKPSDKEIVIELPLPKEQWAEISLLETYADLLEKEKRPMSAGILKTLLEKLRETRTIKIKGKNVDNLDVENLQSLIVEAYEESSKVKSKGLRKYLKIFKGEGE